MEAGAADGEVPVVAGAGAVLVAAAVVDSAEALVVAAASAAGAREVVGKGDVNWPQIR